jgi:hypothetical protein
MTTVPFGYNVEHDIAAEVEKKRHVCTVLVRSMPPGRDDLEWGKVQSDFKNSEVDFGLALCLNLATRTVNGRLNIKRWSFDNTDTALLSWNAWKSAAVIIINQ